MPFKRTTQAYLLKTSLTHNENLIPILNLLINYISAKSALQILSLNDEYTFLLLKFAKIGLWNSSASCWFDIDLIASPKVFLSSNL